jgi:hypothetical protein
MGRTGLPVVLSAVALAKEEAFLAFVASATEVAKAGGRGNGGCLKKRRTDCVRRFGMNSGVRSKGKISMYSGKKYKRPFRMRNRLGLGGK